MIFRPFRPVQRPPDSLVPLVPAPPCLQMVSALCTASGFTALTGSAKLTSCTCGLIFLVHPFQIELSLLGRTCEVVIAQHLHRHVLVNQPDRDVPEVLTRVSIRL